MKYPQAFIEKLKDNAVLSEVIQKYIPLKRKGHEYQACCPFHKEKTPSFTVNDDKAFYHCFGCAAHGTVFDFIMHMENMTFPEAIGYVADMQGVALPQVVETPQDKERQSQEQRLLKLNEDACNFFQRTLMGAEGASARKYLEKRGLAQDTVNTFRLGYALDDFQNLRAHFLTQGYSDADLKLAGLTSHNDDPNKNPYDKFRGRVIFPIFNRKGQVIAFGGRSIGNGEPKYLNSPETPLFHKGYVLYGANFATKSKLRDEPPVVVEGYMDVIALYQSGYDKAVAPLGTALTDHHLKLLWRLHSTPVLCFDGDNAGIRAAQRSAEKALPYLKAGHSLSFLTLEKGHDPDSYVQEHGLPAFKALFDQATPLAELMWAILTERTPPNSPESIAFLRKKIFETCKEIGDAGVSTYYQKYFSQSLYKLERDLAYKPKPAQPRAPGLSPGTIQQRILLATLFVFPALIEDVEEEFCTLTFTNQALAELQTFLLDYYHQKKPLEKQAVQSYLEHSSQSKADRMLNLNDLYVHAPFLKGEDVNLAKEHWQHIYNNYNNNDKKDQLDAKQRLAGDFSLEAWERFKSLKKLK